ncbi:hypothetical protein BD310DRAFT_919764 [Dichomitus squalens]|uniref:Uncharacterized protein n=1 Tax=Dichomitus squalens TaxID=114155 RepID=A0A4Q9Q4D9_9APHY|nr:hypothetical protein BD310DRAFT_919764 [Dichomitus squalens]
MRYRHPMPQVRAYASLIIVGSLPSWEPSQAGHLIALVEEHGKGLRTDDHSIPAGTSVIGLAGFVVWLWGTGDRVGPHSVRHRQGHSIVSIRIESCHCYRC